MTTVNAEHHQGDSAGLSEAAPSAPALAPFWFALGRGFTLVGWAAIVLVNGVYGISVGWGLGPVLDFAIMALAGFLFVFLFEGIAILSWKILNAVLPRLRLGTVNRHVQAVPAEMIGRLIGILLMVFGDLLWPESIFKYATLSLPGKFMVMAAATSGALIFAARTLKRPVARYAPAALAASLLLAVGYWLMFPGTDDYVTAIAPVDPSVATLDLPNPGIAGPHAVATMTYGRGTSERRPEYGRDADLITPPVDGSALFEAYGGFIGRYFEWYNGFGFASLPLNGMVWFPEGNGPFPLVLIVHGNHAMTEPSEPGYAYLAEHLASQGMIVVSVDENYLNGFALDDPDMAEMPLRAWILLKHLEQWREWNASEGNPFYGRVDLDRIGLVGHSRGGEAVAHAAEMNARPAGRIATVSRKEDFGFGIRGVVALAPCDNRYKPAGRPLRLRNADYLLLSGGHDGDMYYLDGMGQYARANFDENPAGFKAVAYLYRGNHGNFNTVWGDDDKGWFNSLLLNRAPLLAAEEQQQAAKTFITAFMEASLNDKEAYRAVFYNPIAAHTWLPEDVIVTQYRDAGFVPLDTNERGSREDLDVPGGLAEARGMTDWRSEGRTLRDGETNVPNRGLLLEWAAGTQPLYELALPEGQAAEWGLTADHALSFTLANMGDAGAPGRIWIEVEAGDATARLPLDSFGPPPLPLPARLTKADWIAGVASYEIATVTPYERVDQTYDIPLASFGEVVSDFQPDALTAIRFLFDGSEDGRLLIDEIGFRTP